MHRNEVASGDEALSNEPKNRLFNPPTSSKNGFANYEHGNWRDFLRGTGEQPSSNSRRYKNSKEECPLVCPPCEETARHRRQAKLNSAEIDVRLGTCNVQRDRTVSSFYTEAIQTLLHNNNNFICFFNVIMFSVKSSWFASIYSSCDFVSSKFCYKS